MTVTKDSISKNISKIASITKGESSLILDAFFMVVKNQTKTKKVKVNNFGSFLIKVTPERAGRNPKTKESYIISRRSKLTFKASNNIRESLN
tara:strand:- start:701 stop:976 length:276 start_codon:yes stop_codon:yes gene_type:complete